MLGHPSSVRPIHEAHEASERPTTLRLDLCPHNMAASVNGRVLTTPRVNPLNLLGICMGDF